ncbi:MAG: A/G-specific adenine glycosylase [Planctomycetes bacterium]|nr:A/G-specific adenine glycosylase [Planctomycetota bacterium]
MSRHQPPVRISIANSPGGAAPGDWLPVLQSALRGWFGRQARDLPWRRQCTPYAVWISEIMLQQTQVAAVIPYFQRFLARFPDVLALAAAEEEEVLRYWEGLGYYRRARQLHAAARQVIQNHQGELPPTAAALANLPGIGRYTAGAIASIAFGVPAPILEANTLRLWCRLAAIRSDPTRSSTQEKLWQLASHAAHCSDPGLINQALMEVGSQICTPRSPNCGACPLANICSARHLGLQARLPRPGRKTRYEELREAAIVVHDQGRFLLRKCRDGERWAGMWDFPRCPLEQLDHDSASVRGHLARHCVLLTGAKIKVGPLFATVKHGVTRFRITLYCYHATRANRLAAACDSTTRWISPEELADLPLSVTGRKIARLLTRHGLPDRTQRLPSANPIREAAAPQAAIGRGAAVSRSPARRSSRGNRDRT